MTAHLNGEGLSLARSNRYIQVNRVSGDPVHWTGLAPKGSADHPDVGAVIVNDFGNIESFYFLVSRSGHLERRWKISPKLESMHPPGPVALGHLLMDDPAACSHPLHVAGGDHTAIAHAVAVLDCSRQHVGDGFDAAMGMPWKA